MPASARWQGEVHGTSLHVDQDDQLARVRLGVVVEHHVALAAPLRTRQFAVVGVLEGGRRRAVARRVQPLLLTRAEANQLLDEVVHAIALRRCDVLPLAPSEPVPLVVGPGGVGIVVAELSPHPLVTAEDERRSAADEHRGEEVPHLRPLHGLTAPVVAAVVLLARLGVAPDAQRVITALGVEQAALILLVVVGDEIVQGEAVVHGDEVDAVVGMASLVSIDRLRAKEHSSPVNALGAVQHEGRAVEGLPAVALRHPWRP